MITVKVQDWGRWAGGSWRREWVGQRGKTRKTGETRQKDNVSFSCREHERSSTVWSPLVYLVTWVEEDYFSSSILASYKERLRRNWLWSSNCQGI